ncbi:MAG: response regulator transcription factor [Sulfurospirillum sp.]|nr:response regulator transcription factor [Sulfurospirillum sp.]
MQTNIIMIEDDEELAMMLIDFLAKYNVSVENFDDPYIGISAMNIKKYDLLILDLSLPSMDGLEICREIRTKRNNIPIIISSARSDLEDKIIGLELGADDYLPKPYEPKELYARIMSVLRRYKKGSFESFDEEEAAIKLAKNGAEILFNGVALPLTRAEFEVLSYMLKKRECVISRNELIHNAPSLNEESDSRSLDVLISRIRSKLGENSKNQQYIRSIRGVGYRLHV